MTLARTLIFIALSFLLMGCDEEKPKNRYVLKEAIEVRGTCSENHVGQIDIDTSQPKWILYGVSKSLGDGDNVQGYNSSCELEVVKRDNKVWKAADLLKALKD